MRAIHTVCLMTFELALCRRRAHSSSISPSSLPECTAGSSFGSNLAGGVLTRRSRGAGIGDRSRGVSSLLDLWNEMVRICWRVQSHKSGQQ